jgi:acetyl-CoA C-acetyltransferase
MARVVVVGVGQRTFRFETWDDFVGPVDAMRSVVEAAAEDAGAPRLAREADSVHVVNILSWPLRDPPRALAEALGARAEIREYTCVGGNTPQWLVNRAADNLAAGRSRISVLAGCELMASIRRAAKEGRDLGAFNQSVEVPLVGKHQKGTLDVELAHDADLPVRIYPLLENALRAKEGLSPGEQRRWLGRYGERCSRVAASNPHAWRRTAWSAEEIATPSDRNRMLGYPYTRHLNSEMYVDQAAAAILTTEETARALGVPESKWVYLHGGQDAHDLWFVSERPDLAASPAIEACVGDALGQASIELDRVSFFDLYSCFPVMPRLTLAAMGLSRDEERPITLTGGLPFFGGAGNNYTMHAIAEAVERCRRSPEEFGLVTANGYYATKHSVGVYGASPPARAWGRTPPEAFQERLALPESLEVDLTPSGRFTVDAYTVWHDRSGAPEYSVLCGRTESGKRAWGRTPEGDLGLLEEMMREEWVGRSGRFAGRKGQVNIVEFS